MPDDLSDAHDNLLEVLELRREGLAKIADALRVALGDQDAARAPQVAKEMRVFLASDVSSSRASAAPVDAVLRRRARR